MREPNPRPDGEARTPDMKPNIDLIDLGSITWVRSSYSNGAGGMCVEIGHLEHGGALVRDSKQPEGAVLAFSANEWAAFLLAARAAEFGVPDGTGLGL